MLRAKGSRALTLRLTTTTTQCKKHPKHKQSPGVCSLCLTERLAKLRSARSRLIAYSDSDASSSDLSSSSSDLSSCVSVSPPSRGFHLVIKNTNTEKSRFWANLLTGRRRKTTRSRGR